MHQATNAHDLDALVACFAPDFGNDTPAHPERSFTGRERVRRNWTQIFAAIPDLSTEVLRVSVDGDTRCEAWSFFGVSDGLAVWARFYLEPRPRPDVDRRCWA